MSGKGKGLLIGCGGMLLLAVIVIAGIVFFVNQRYGQMLDEKAEEGRAFGDVYSKQGCLDHILLKAEKSKDDLPSIESLLGDETFLSSCLESARADATFCDGVPSIGGEFGKTMQGEVYEEKMCKLMGYGEHNPTCKMVYSAKQKYCWGK